MNTLLILNQESSIVRKCALHPPRQNSALLRHLSSSLFWIVPFEKNKSSFEHTPSSQRNETSLSAWVHFEALKLHPLTFNNASYALLYLLECMSAHRSPEASPFNLHLCAMCPPCLPWVHKELGKPKEFSFILWICALHPLLSVSLFWVHECILKTWSLFP